MNITVKNDLLGQPLLFLVCVSDFLKLWTSLRATASLLGIRIFNEQLRRGLVSLILRFLALSLLSARRLGRRQGFLRTVPGQLFSS